MDDGNDFLVAGKDRDMPTYDLSHTLESGMPVYPGTPPVEIDPLASMNTDGYRVAQLTLDTHAGTHIDAPAHMLESGASHDEFPLESYRFAALLVDLDSLEDREPIDANMLRASVGERSLEETDMLVVRTGWETYWGTDRYLDHPYFTPGAAAMLCEWDCHLGVDMANVDPTPSQNKSDDEPEGHPVHHTLFEDDRLILENLRGLESVPTRFELHAYPLPIANADASPTRAVAVVEESTSRTKP